MVVLLFSSGTNSLEQPPFVAKVLSHYGLGAAASSFGFTGGVAQAELLPNSCKIYEVGHEVSLAAENALDIAGFPNIEVDGAISSKTEQAAVYAAQVTLKDVGALDESIKICGYAGDATRKAAEFVVNADGASDAETETPEIDYTEIELSDCKGYDKFTIESIKAVQKALGIFVDGRFLEKTCEALVEYQDETSISQYGRGVLGPRTSKSLGVVLQPKTTQSSTNTFNPEKACPKKNSCEIFIDLTKQKGFIKTNDGNDATANGETLYTYPIQSGKPGSETDTGLFWLGDIEYGKDGSPWRTSTLGSSDGTPNLYKFRRYWPAKGGNNGEGSHGSPSYGIGEGSSGCTRTTKEVQDVIAELPTRTWVLISGQKPVR